MLCFFLLRFRGYQTLTLTLPHPRQALYRLNHQPLREVFFHQPLPHGIWENVLSALSLACHSRDGTTRYNATSLLLCLVTWFDILEACKGTLSHLVRLSAVLTLLAKQHLGGHCPSWGLCHLPCAQNHSTLLLRGRNASVSVIARPSFPADINQQARGKTQTAS